MDYTNRIEPKVKSQLFRFRVSVQEFCLLLGAAMKRRMEPNHRREIEMWCFLRFREVCHRLIRTVQPVESVFECSYHSFTNNTWNAINTHAPAITGDSRSPMRLAFQQIPYNPPCCAANDDKLFVAWLVVKTVGYKARKNEVEQMNNKITTNNDGKSNNADMLEITSRTENGADMVDNIVVLPVNCDNICENIRSPSDLGPFGPRESGTRAIPIGSKVHEK
jgi:hypothetical protein